MGKFYRFVIFTLLITFFAGVSSAMPPQAKSKQSIPFDNWLAFGGGITGLRPNTGPSYSLPVPPGRLHALSITVSTPPGADNYCGLSFFFSLSDGTNTINKWIISIPYVWDGDTSVKTLTLDAPIEFDFDPTIFVLRYHTSIVGNIPGPGDLCYWSYNGVYETFEAPAEFLPDPYDDD